MNGPKNLLIVGDWVVDDNWQTGVHRSSTSLRTGSTHRRALHAPATPVQAFCGAGRLASILYDARHNKLSTDQVFAIHGLGVWKREGQKDDTKLLTSMFDFEFRKHLGPYSLHSTPLDDAKLPTSVYLHNMAEFLSKSSAHQDEPFATTRAYRVFQRQENELRLLARTDWEQPPKHRDAQGAPEWIVRGDHSELCNFLDSLKLSSPAAVDAVIIKDLIKGVVTETLVEVLAEKFPAVPWFVSTKRWEPPWLNKLAKVKLKLFLIPPIAANTALTDSAQNAGLDSWIAPAKAKPTSDALKCVGEIEKKICPIIENEDAAPVIAVCPREGSILAKKGDQFVVHDGAVAEGATLVGWATAFFSALCAPVMEKPPNGVNLRDTVDFGLDFASAWAASEARYLKEPDSKDLPHPERLELTRDRQTVPFRCSKPASWQEEWDAWTAATSATGIIPARKVGDNGRLELWRGMTAVNNYTCLRPEKRRDLSRLVAHFRSFARGIERHQAVQLMAEPGSGKSHLVECLADASKLRMLSFNITHMNRREDIISCFDTMCCFGNRG